MAPRLKAAAGFSLRNVFCSNFRSGCRGAHAGENGKNHRQTQKQGEQFLTVLFHKKSSF